MDDLAIAEPVILPAELLAVADVGGRRIARSIWLRLVGEREARFIENERGNPWDKADDRLREWARRTPRGGGVYDVVLATIRWPGMQIRTEYRLRTLDARMLPPCVLLARHVKKQAEFYAGRNRGLWEPDSYAAHIRTFDPAVVARYGRLLDEYAIGARGAGELQTSFF